MFFRESPGACSAALPACVLAIAMALPQAAMAQAVDGFPSRPMKMIIPFPPGGGTDIIGRTVASKVQEAWGQAVVVDNQAGANGTIGLTMGMKAAPDGYTLTLISTATSINPHIYPNLRYDLLRDFLPLSQLTTQPYLLVIHPSVPARSIQDLLGVARARPGQLNFGSSGVGGTSHMAGELLASLAGIKLTHVPYKGGNPAMQDVVAGNIQMLFSTMLQAQSFIKDGRLRPLGVSGARRHPAMADLPTIAEAGVPGFEVAGWFGLALPVRTPDPVVARWSAELTRVMRLPEVASRIAADGSQAVGGTPEEFRTLIRSEIVKWGKIVKEAGIRAD